MLEQLLRTSQFKEQDFRNEAFNESEYYDADSNIGEEDEDESLNETLYPKRNVVNRKKRKLITEKRPAQPKISIPKSKADLVDEVDGLVFNTKRISRPPNKYGYEKVQECCAPRHNSRLLPPHSIFFFFWAARAKAVAN